MAGEARFLPLCHPQSRSVTERGLSGGRLAASSTSLGHIKSSTLPTLGRATHLRVSLSPSREPRDSIRVRTLYSLTHTLLLRSLFVPSASPAHFAQYVPSRSSEETVAQSESQVPGQGRKDRDPLSLRPRCCRLYGRDCPHLVW